MGRNEELKEVERRCCDSQEEREVWMESSAG